MKGYKGFNADMTCRGFQYEVGKEYEIDGEISLCNHGFHFCKKMADAFGYYGGIDCRYAEVEAIGEIIEGDDKCVTDKIRIIKEIPRLEAVGMSNSGHSNSGHRNSGHWNSGHCNSGDWNSGHRNSGNWNSGDWNSGDWNSGHRNSGHWNSGHWNSGDRNSGNWNSGDWNSGVFCTNKNPTIKLFDKDSDWTINDWINSSANRVMSGCPYSHSDFIYEPDMTEEEKADHPEHKTIGGYVKAFTVTNEDKQKWWNGLPDKDKQAVYSLPNFDADKFRQCTGIEVEHENR